MDHFNMNIHLECAYYYKIQTNS